MRQIITFEHKTLGDFHVITSPEVVGFHITGKTPEEAERAAVAVLDYLRRADSDHRLGRLKAVALEYDAA